MSARRDKSAVILIGLMMLLVIAAVLFILVPRLKSQTTVHLGDGVFTTREIIAVGSGDALLPSMESVSKNSAVLVVADEAKKWPVVISSDNVFLDLVWLDADKKVVHIVKNIVTEDNMGRIYTPKVDALYVLQLPIGSATSRVIKLNQTATFDDADVQGLHG